MRERLRLLLFDLHLLLLRLYHWRRGARRRRILRLCLGGRPGAARLTGGFLLLLLLLWLDDLHWVGAFFYNSPTRLLLLGRLFFGLWLSLSCLLLFGYNRLLIALGLVGT